MEALEHVEPPEESVELAFKLTLSAQSRGMDYEEFSFEIEGGEDDGTMYKVLVMRI